MKSKATKLLTILVILTFYIYLSNNFYKLIEPKAEGVNPNLTNNDILKISAYFEKIHINNNWSDARISGICSGSGNYSDPYVIEDLLIDGGSFGSCILIENSNDYFRIENCTLYNSGGPFVYNYAGILLINVSNGELLNNSCDFNFYGIYLIESSNISIKGNKVTNNDFGITLYYSGFSTVINNNVSNSDYGISLWDGNSNNISKNSLLNNAYFGIRLFGNQNLVSNNSVINSNVGILILRGQDNTVLKNNANDNTQGIYLDQTINNTIAENNVCYNNHTGIRLFESKMNKISRNYVNNNTINGIILKQNSNSNNITRNNATNNQYGIYLHYSNNNTVSGNGLIGNNVCIFEDNCQGNEFYDNGGCIPSRNEENNDLPPTIDFTIILLISGLIIVGIIVVTEVKKFRRSK